MEIQDEGPPFAQKEIHRIANQSDWIKEQLLSGREDLALGLRIAIEFVKIHGGRLWTESLDTKQNMICFTLPKKVVPREVAVEMSSSGMN